ncbi:Mannosylfructose-phosphate synthase [compost metagenome]
MSLSIAVNGQRLAGQRFGVGRYIEYMLRHWATQLEGDETVSLFVRRPLDEDLASLSPRIQPVLLDSGMSGLPWETLRLRGAAASQDVLFCPAYTAPLAYPGRMVVATHSVNEVQSAAHSWVYRQTHSRLHRACARRADAVIVPAQSTRDLVVDHYGVSPERIAIVHQGTDDAFSPIEDEALLSAVRTRFFGHDRPYILFVGKCSARRNIPMLLEAFARLRATRNIPHGLLLFGPCPPDLPLADLCEKLGITNHVVQTDGVIEHHADIVPVYAAASVFVHPSEYEGWSMTTVEALACGVAVVAADRGGLGEVARGHALMVTPEREALSDAIGRVLEDDDLRRDLQRRGRERGRSLRWSENARQTLDVLRSVAMGSALQGEAR